MRLFALILACAALGAPALGAPAGADTPLAALPYTPSLDPAAMDRSADACVDFYQYACGGWMKANPIPPDQASWSVYRKLAQDNQRFLWGILDGLAKRTAGRDATQRQIGDYFAACMDEAAVEARGLAPLRAYLEPIDAHGLEARARRPCWHVFTSPPGTAASSSGFGRDRISPTRRR